MPFDALIVSHSLVSCDCRREREREIERERERERERALERKAMEIVFNSIIAL